MFISISLSLVCNISCPAGFVPNSACNGCNGVHICVTNNPCQNGGTCVIGSGGNADYTCSCTNEFSGRNCESTRSLSLSLPLSVSILVFFFIACNISCPVGFVPNSACDSCTGVHICVTNNPCQNGGTCIIGSGGNNDYTCSCSGEFAGQNCENGIHTIFSYSILLSTAISFQFQTIIAL